MKDENPSEYLTLKQVSDLLKVHPNTLRNWDNNGTLKPLELAFGRLDATKLRISISS